MGPPPRKDTTIHARADADRPDALSPAGRGAIAALARALDLRDRLLGRRAALRALLIDHVGPVLGFSAGQLGEAMSAALVGDIAILATTAPPAAHDRGPMSSIVAASLVDTLPDLGGVAEVLRQQAERVDGTGGPLGVEGDELLATSRLLAIVNELTADRAVDGHADRALHFTRVRVGQGNRFDSDLAARVVEELTARPVNREQATIDHALARLEHLAFPIRRADDPAAQIHRVGEAIRAADRTAEVVEVLAEHAVAALGCASVSVGRIDEGNRLVVLANVGLLGPDDERFPTDEVYPADQLPSFTRFLDGVPHQLTTVGRPPLDPVSRYLRSRGLLSELASPIRLDGALWGAVWATTRPGQRELGEADLPGLRAVAEELAAGISQAERLEEVETLALHDPLTGVYNRRVMERQLSLVFERSTVDRQDVALIMADVDGLKVVNDTHGHAAGDKVLVDAARSLTEAVDDIGTATVCRIGGDEFCIILDGGGLLRADLVADRADELFARTGDGRSMSIGVALATPDRGLPGDLLRAADIAQYQQKRLRKAAAGELLPEVPQRGSGRRAHRDATQ